YELASEGVEPEGQLDVLRTLVSGVEPTGPPHQLDGDGGVACVELPWRRRPPPRQHRLVLPGQHHGLPSRPRLEAYSWWLEQRADDDAVVTGGMAADVLGHQARFRNDVVVQKEEERPLGPVHAKVASRAGALVLLPESP